MSLPVLHGKHIFIALGIAFTIVLTTVGFLQYALPSLLVFQYKHQINTAFDTFFTPDLQERLYKIGFLMQFEKPTSCDNGPYSPSSPCSRYSGSNTTKVDSSSSEAWKKVGKELDTYLINKGWQREANNRNETLDSLAHTDAFQVFVSYTRQQQGVTCYLTAEYLDRQEYGTISLSEHCYKYTTSPTDWLKNHLGFYSRIDIL